MTGRRRQDSDEGSWLSVEDGWRPWGSVYGLVVESRRERFATKP